MYKQNVWHHNYSFIQFYIETSYMFDIKLHQQYVGWLHTQILYKEYQNFCRGQYCLKYRNHSETDHYQ